MSFLTCFCDFPQNEHFSRSPPSPMRATSEYLVPRRPRHRAENLFVDGTAWSRQIQSFCAKTWTSGRVPWSRFADRLHEGYGLAARGPARAGGDLAGGDD